MNEIFKSINKYYIEFKFYNQIQKKDLKYTIWKKYLDCNKSLSSMYLLSFILISDLKWDGLIRKDLSNAEKVKARLIKKEKVTTYSSYIVSKLVPIRSRN